MATPSWLTYSNSGATRSQPISPDLVRAMSFLPELGVTMNVYSGGQPASGANRVGSARHDHGNAADVTFYQDGRMLNWNNERDLAVLSDIVSRARASGVTGIGAGDDYMGPGRVHIGFGPEAVWGAGGKTANAPEWLRRAFSAPASAQGTSIAQRTNAALNRPTGAAALPQQAAPGLSGMLQSFFAPQQAGQPSGLSGMFAPSQGVPQYYSDPIAYGTAVQTSGGDSGWLSSSPGRQSFDQSAHGMDMSVMRANQDAIRRATGSGTITQDTINQALANGATLVRRI